MAKKSYNKIQLNLAVGKAVDLIRNHDFPVMASRVWDIYRANFPLCVVSQYWKSLPDQGNPPDFNKVLASHSSVITVKTKSNTYYLYDWSA